MIIKKIRIFFLFFLFFHLMGAQDNEINGEKISVIDKNELVESFHKNMSQLKSVGMLEKIIISNYPLFASIVNILRGSDIERTKHEYACVAKNNESIFAYLKSNSPQEKNKIALEWSGSYIKCHEGIHISRKNIREIVVPASYHKKPWNEIVEQFHADMQRAQKIGTYTEIGFTVDSALNSLGIIENGYRLKDAFNHYDCQSKMYVICTRYQQAKTEDEKNKIALKFVSFSSKCSSLADKRREELLYKKTGIKKK